MEVCTHPPATGHDTVTRAEWIVIWCHSRGLYPGRPFVPMPPWINDIRDRCKRYVDPTDDEYTRCREFVLSVRPDVPDPDPRRTG